LQGTIRLAHREESTSLLHYEQNRKQKVLSYTERPVGGKKRGGKEGGFPFRQLASEVIVEKHINGLGIEGGKRREAKFLSRGSWRGGTQL